VETIRLDPKMKYPLTREVFRAVMEDFLRHEERMARTLEDRRIIADFRDEWVIRGVSRGGTRYGEQC
jgi:hypothetical protein